MKRFLRYLLLAGCVLTLGLCIISHAGGYEIRYNSYSITLFNGILFFTGSRDQNYEGFDFYRLQRLDFLFTKGILLPLWLIFILLFFISLIAFVHWKATKRITNQKGFEVDVKSEEKT